ncbi:hypothetical protein SAMN02745673_03752 [Marinactinospora thermotolerans DSM 45154]|uniref:Uncharacterized protein n=2 Tax=Marinactinospora thermotolerans TaxID=531310 RepID=A0A1T4SND9_9ACTN|nr:hypothetical protein SAMN02745673_03752 [Marinactinospora thermotolerans DSM 45154]
MEDMPGTNDADGVTQLAISLVDAYVRKDRDAVGAAVAEAERSGGIDDVTSELKVYASFLTRRVQETGVVWKPADSREAVARTVADILEPELEFAVVTAWEAHSVGEHEAAERFTRGDPLVFLHMLAAFCAAIGQAVYKPAELISTLRIASGSAE